MSDLVHLCHSFGLSAIDFSVYGLDIARRLEASPVLVQRRTFAPSDFASPFIFLNSISISNSSRKGRSL
jgi:hypothetical protein